MTAKPGRLAVPSLLLALTAVVSALAQVVPLTPATAPSSPPVIRISRRGGQPPSPPRKLEPLAQPQDIVPPSKDLDGPDIFPPSFSEPLGCGVPVTLPDVLKLAVLANLDIEQARVAVARAQIGVRRASAAYLPNVAIGALYTTHEGTIQNAAGNISVVNRDSLFVGLGTGLTFSLGEAIYALPQARNLLLAARWGETRVVNNTLLQVSDAYFNVLRARRQMARLDETLEFLASDQESALRGDSRGLLPLIKAFVRAGTALPSDQARVEADVVRRTAERSRAAEDVRVAAAELSRLLHIDPSIFLLPVEDYRWPLPIAGEAWHCQPMDVLVGQALRARPELAENAALVEASLARYRAAQWRPLLPTFITNLSHGGFGGGPQVVGRTATGGNVMGTSGVIADFGPRTDIDLGVQWRFEGLGLGNLYQIRDRRLQVQQAQLRQLALQDAVVSQVVQAVEQIRRAKERVDLVRAGLYDEQNRPNGAIYRSLRLNFVRIKGGQGLPLEVLDSTRRLSDVLQAYSDALSDYDRARVRLLVALGFPPAALLDPECVPPPPEPH